MKKVILSVALAMTLVVNAFAFQDISDANTKTAVNTLTALGIVNGVGNNQFNPSGTVKRSEFAKMAVLALGETNLESFKNFTIFPDVPHTHWSSGYVNAAVNEGIIKGFPDGTFKPDNTINFGEAITMMLYMLDYEIADIGALWPADYIAKASELGITDGVSVSATRAVTRGEAAIMIYNLLDATAKEGETLMDKSFSNKDEDATILEVKSDTNEVLIMAGESEKTVSNKATDLVVGANGTAIYDDGGSLIAFIMDGFYETVVIKYADIDRLVTENGDIDIKTDTAVIVDGESSTYGEAWLQIFPGSNVFINKNSKGDITSISVNNDINTTNFMYDSGKNIPSYPIYKNGVKIESSSIKNGNIITIDEVNKMVFVSDKTITGSYEMGTPSVFYPSEVTVLGEEFDINESLKSAFSNISLGDNITLYLDYSGDVFSVKKDAKSTQLALLNSYSEGSANVTIDGLHTVDIQVDEELTGYFNYVGTKISNITKLEGQFVELSFTSSGKVKISEIDNLVSVNADYNLESGTLGGTKVSSDVEYYEGHNQNSGYIRISPDDITLDIIPKENIIGIMKTGNEITKIIFKNLTGNYYDYGIGTVTSTEISIEDADLGTSTYDEYDYTLKTEGNTLTYDGLNYVRLGNIPVGIPKNTSGKSYKINRKPRKSDK